MGGIVAPRLTALIATRRFGKSRLRPHIDNELLPIGATQFVVCDDEVKKGYLWKACGPTVLLMHGWPSDSSSMFGFVKPLLLSFHKVKAFCCMIQSMKCKRTFDGRSHDHHTLQIMRQQAVKAVRAGQPVDSVAAAFGVNKRSVYRRLSAFINGGQNALLISLMPYMIKHHSNFVLNLGSGH